jgi:glycosyltransferase involved in cell wall biosynthesis
MSAEHRISVIIPCFRDSATLARAIDSVIAQTRSVDEIIVVNDCSPETALIEQVLSRYPDVVYVQNAVNLGLAATRNAGISAATGDIVSFLDSDDELHPQKIEFQLSQLQENSAVSCAVELIQCGLRRTALPMFVTPGEVQVVRNTRRMEFSNFLTGASLMVSKKLLQTVGSYDESLRSCEDFDMWLRLVENGTTIFHLKTPLYFYYFNPSGLSKDPEKISQWEIEVLKRHFKRKPYQLRSSLMESVIWAVWLFKHMLRAESSSNQALRRQILENASALIPLRFFAWLVMLLCRTRVALLYVRIRQCLH